MDAAAVPAQSGSLWHVVVHRPWIWIDVLLLVVLLAIQIITYLSKPAASSNPVATSSALSSGASGGLTVVGILLPPSLLAIQLRTGSSSVKLSDSALADFFAAWSGWSVRWPPPFKPPATAAYRAAVAPIRAQVLAERPEYTFDFQVDDESELSRLVPDETLMLTHEQLYDAMANADVERLFRDGPGLLTAPEPATTH